MLQLCNQIQNIARKTGTMIRNAGQLDNMIPDADHANEDITIKPGHANFVTYYDKQVQAYLIKALSCLLPDASFLGEEDGREQFQASYATGYTFVIDPIDGTSNFMKGNPPCVTSIGLLKDGEPYLGVVFAPFSNQMFYALRGKGAYENGRPIHASEMPLSMSLVTMGTAPYRADLSPKAFALAARYMPICIDIRRTGSAAWDLCMVASGRIGLYYEPHLCLHDYAAGALIAAEAGAKITDLDGKPLTFRGETSIAAASTGVARETYLPDPLFHINWMTDLF